MKRQRTEGGADEGPLNRNSELTPEETLHESRRRFLKQAIVAGVSAVVLPGLS